MGFKCKSQLVLYCGAKWRKVEDAGVGGSIGRLPFNAPAIRPANAGPKGDNVGTATLVDDRAAHQQAVRLPIATIVERLRGTLGVGFVSALAGVRETRAVNEWADGRRDIRSRRVEARLRFVFQVAELLRRQDPDVVVRAWFESLDPLLDYRSPTELLVGSEVHEVGAEILRAAQAFSRGG